ncbi:MAG: hypothetical protein ABFC38_03885 [Methanospirillum sp.]
MLSLQEVHDVRRRPTLHRPRAEPVREERVDAVRLEQADKLPPLLERRGRRLLRRITQHGREGENPVVREQGVRPAARERQPGMELAQPHGERRVGGCGAHR